MQSDIKKKLLKEKWEKNNTTDHAHKYLRPTAIWGFLSDKILSVIFKSVANIQNDKVYQKLV